MSAEERDNSRRYTKFQEGFIMLEQTVTMAHGSGGESTGRLIAELFAKNFSNEYLDRMTDSSVVPGSTQIAMTTDSFVVTPVEYPGGDIGRLAVCGTVNDLLMSGAVPKYLTAGFILEEGLPMETLRRVVKSMADTAREAGVLIVTGDTKVVENHSSDAKGEGGLYINTAGVGFVPEGTRLDAASIRPGDKILVSGTLGEHHATILAKRMGLENESLESDNAPLDDIVNHLRTSGAAVRAMRDVTRGGLATVLSEFVLSSGQQIEIEESLIPVKKPVRDFCGILGLEPVYMGNEGKLIAVIAPEDASKALDAVRSAKYGENAAIIGEVAGDHGEGSAELILKTPVGGRRVLGPLYGEGLPRIC